MIDVRHPERQVAYLARIRDEKLAGMASGPAARALLASLVAEQAQPAATAPRRSPVRRLVLAAAAVVAVAAVAVVGPGMMKDGPGGARSYANTAIDVRFEGDVLVVRIMDPLADPARYEEAFRAVGKDVDIELVPVSSPLVGQLLRAGTGPGGPVEVHTELVGSGPDPIDCASTPARCTIVIRISRDTTGTVQYKVGRAAQPGETLQDPVRDAGEPSTPSRTTGGAANGGGN